MTEGANRSSRPTVSLRTYLRIIPCTVVGAAYLALGVAGLLLYVNPTIPSSLEVLLRLLADLLPAYGAAATLGYALLSFVLQPFLISPMARRALDPLLLSWLLLCDLLLLAAVYWCNTLETEFLLSPRQHAHLVRASVALSVAFAGAMTAHAVQYLYPARRRAARRALTAIALLSLVTLYLERRPSLGAPARRHTLVLDVESSGRPLSIVAIDGLSFDDLKPLEAAGRLPTFSRLLSQGASARLRSIWPCDPAITWTTLATGKLPFRHQVEDAFTYSFPGLSRPFRVTPRYVLFRTLTRAGPLKASPTLRWDRTALALWNILDRAGERVGIVNWPTTYPAERLHGFIISDLLVRSPEGLPQVTFPEHLLPEALRATAEASDASRGAVDEIVAEAKPGEEARREHEALRKVLVLARSRDLGSRNVADMLARRYRPGVLALRLDGLESVLRDFMKFHRPEEFGDITGDDERRYGKVVSGYYEMLDGFVAERLRDLPEGGLLCVVSSSGMEPLGLLRRIVRMPGDSLQCASRDGSPDGALMLLGHDIRPGAALEPVDLADVVPTLLYAEGLPTARDMDGDPIFEAFTEDYKARTPVSTIASYEAARIGLPREAPAARPSAHALDRAPGASGIEHPDGDVAPESR